MNEKFIRRAEIRFDFERQKFSTAFRGRFKKGQTENFSMQM